jgi:copper oxidase (laccase) domain-containing protein
MSSISFEKVVSGYLFRVYREKPSFNLNQVDQVHGAVVLDDQALTSKMNEADGLY